MKPSKNSPIILTILMSIVLMVLAQPSLSQQKAIVDTEDIKQDMISSGFDIIPSKIIQKGKGLKMITAGNLCFAHLPYKDYFTDPYMKSSLLAIYELKENHWKLQTIIPYYYEIEPLDLKNVLFISSNEFCNPNGECKYFLEVSAYRNKEMIPLTQQTGFNKYNYLIRLLALGKIDEAALSIGDTITKKNSFKDFNIDKETLMLNSEISILNQILSDSLVTTTSKKTQTIKIKK